VATSNRTTNHAKFILWCSYLHFFAFHLAFVYLETTQGCGNADSGQQFAPCRFANFVLYILKARVVLVRRGEPRSQPNSASRRSRLPNCAPCRRRHWLTYVAVKCILKLRNVTHHTVGSVFRRRVGIGHHPHAQQLGSFVTAPALRVTDKKSLPRCKSVDRLQLLPARRFPPRHVCQDQSTLASTGPSAPVLRSTARRY
jgi:hypothetical protein